MPSADHPPRHFSRKIQPQNGLLERAELVEKLFALFDAGNRCIVIHGESGLGKKTLANAFFHTADDRNWCEQFGWIPFLTNLPKSIVSAISAGGLEGRHDKNEAFYQFLAEGEIQALRNYDITQLIVIEGVDSEQAILKYLPLLEIKKAKILITTHRPFADTRFLNFSIPPLSDGHVFHFFEKAGLKRNILTENEMRAMRGNPWLFRLLTTHIPKTSERDARVFADKIFAQLKTAAPDENLVVPIAQILFDATPMNAAECWVLLQLAALPTGYYDVEMLIAYLLPEAEAPETDELDIKSLTGYIKFSEAWPSKLKNTDTKLTTLMGSLVEKGWLTDFDGEYAIHDNTIRILKNKQLNQAAYFPEIRNCLSINYFIEQNGRLKDNLYYENHLLFFLEFLEESNTDDYLDILWKLVIFYNDTVDYRLELACRLKYLKLAETMCSKDQIADKKADISENYRRLGNLAKAKEYATKALELALSAVSASAPLVTKCKSELGSVYFESGDYELARDLLEAALDSDLKNFGKGHPNVARSQSNLALIYKDLGDYELARDLLEAALDSDLKNFGKEHPNVTRSQSNLANVYSDLGDYERARDLLEAALDSAEKIFGKEHPNVARSQSNLALIYKDLGDYERARDLLEAALDSDLKNFGKGHPNVARSQSNLALIYKDLGDYERARDLLEAALDSAEKIFGKEHPNVATIYNNLALAYVGMGYKPKASEFFEKALANLKKNFEENHPNIRIVLKSIAAIKDKK